MTMKKSFVAILLFVLSSCSEEQFLLSQEIVAGMHLIGPSNPTYLWLVNGIEDDLTISSWSMEGYEFNDLDIQPGESIQYVLVNNMPDGYQNVDVTIVISSSTRFFSITDSVSFSAGKYTKISVLGCDSCGGFHIETKRE